MPTPIRFGMELEVASGAEDALSYLCDEGYAADSYFHEYHCRCGDCRHDRDHYDWTGQEDCTAAGEFISRILTTHTDTADNALSALSEALRVGRCEFDGDTGLHVHVDSADVDDDAVVRLWRIWSLYQDDVATIANATFRGIRGYASGSKVTEGNILGWRQGDAEAREARELFWCDDLTAARQAMQGDSIAGYRTSRWLSGGSNTYEFRVWNSTRSLWRMRMAAYVSAAIVTAAIEGHDVHPDDDQTLLDVIGDHVPDDVRLSIFRQLLANERAA